MLVGIANKTYNWSGKCWCRSTKFRTANFVNVWKCTINCLSCTRKKFIKYKGVKHQAVQEVNIIVLEEKRTKTVRKWTQQLYGDKIQNILFCFKTLSVPSIWYWLLKITKYVYTEIQ